MIFLKMKTPLFPLIFYSFIQPNVIRFFDYFTPALGMPKGFNILNVSNLDETLLSHFSPLLSSKLLQKQQYSLSDNDIYFCCSLILPHVYRLIRSYLGTTASLDVVRLSILYPEDNKNSSGIPHHDSVGHRLKLFVPLRINGTTITPTMYVSRSNNKKWRSYLNPVRSDQSRINSFWCSSDLESLLPTHDDLYIFDTNGVHWGSYNDIILPRTHLVFEFSNIKSYFVRGQVGSQISYNKRLNNLLSKYQLLPLHLIFSR